MNRRSVAETMKEKGCSRQAVLDAIAKGKLDAEKLTMGFLIRPNKRYSEWRPDPKKQEAGRQRARNRKSG